MVDVGCGRGILSRLIDGDVAYVGLNLSPDDLRAECWLGRREDLRIAFSLPMIPVKTGSVDTVICTEVVEHVPRQAGLVAIRDMFRILKPMGRLVVSTPNGRSLSHIARRKLLKRIRPDPNPEHITVYDWDMLRSMALSVGFREVRREPFDIVMEPKTPQAALATVLPMKLRVMLAKWIRALDQLLIMTARKSV